MTLQNVKFADKRTRSIVYGFIRRIENSLSISNIPTEIYDIFLAFYYCPEFFDKARLDCFKISDDKLKITNIKE